MRDGRRVSILGSGRGRGGVFEGPATSFPLGVQAEDLVGSGPVPIAELKVDESNSLWVDENFVSGHPFGSVGGAVRIAPATSVRQSTWGRVKRLF